jgi:hypothetical protein
MTMMMRLADLYNVAHYEAWERRGGKLTRALARRWPRITARLRRPERDDAPPRRAHDRRSRMEVEQVTRQALAKAMLSQMSKENVDIIKAAVRAEILEQVHDEAVALARQELEDEFQRRHEQLQDEFARQRSALEDEMLGEVDRQRARQREELRDGFEEQLSTLTDERDEARQHRDQAETILVNLLRQLLPEGKRQYLYSGGAGVRELDRGRLNEVLARHGLVLKSRGTYSERLVTVRIDAAHVAGHTQFWLAKALPPGVVDEDEPVAEVPAPPPVAAPAPEVGC